MEKHYCQLWAACSPVLCHGVLLHLLSEAKDLPLCCLLRLLISTLDTSHYEVPKSLHVSNHLNWKVNNNLQKIAYSLWNTCKTKASWLVTAGQSCSWKPATDLLDCTWTGFSVSTVMEVRGLSSRVLHQRILSSATPPFRRKWQTSQSEI